MQFIHHGPEVPDRLLQAHEEGRVVFVCGEHLGRMAGFPPWGTETERLHHLYSHLGLTPNAAEQAALANHRPDTALGLLEARHPGGRVAVRTVLAQALTPTAWPRGITQCHQSILKLASWRDPHSADAAPITRVVTTAMDRRFELALQALKRTALSPFLSRYCAPALPEVRTGWSGLVFLHGHMGTTGPTGSTGSMGQQQPSMLDALTLSHTDLARAYVGEGETGRWVRELLRHHTVCLLGFRPDDPVIRHWGDAIDTLSSSPSVFAFAAHPLRKRDACVQAWMARGIEPLPYLERQRHRLLHQTLHAWALYWHDGSLSRERVVAQYASHRPTASTREDDIVARMRWALSDPSGATAQRFADASPTPPIEWLAALSDPTAPNTSPALFGTEFMAGHWTDVSRPLAHWWGRHLHDPRLILWVTQQSQPLPEALAALVRKGLEAAPTNGMPTAVSALWHLLLSGHVACAAHTPATGALAAWFAQVRRHGLTPALRFMLRSLLSPCIALHATLSSTPDAVHDPIHWRLIPKAPRASSELPELWHDPIWRDTLAALLPDATQVLIDAMALIHALDAPYQGEPAPAAWATSELHPSDPTDTRPSVWQEWTVLIDLVQQSWLGCAQSDPDTARWTVTRWCDQDDPVFSRLALTAATTRPDVVTPATVLGWLTDIHPAWLWSPALAPEVLDWLHIAAAGLDASGRDRLETVLLQGPQGPQGPDPSPTSQTDPHAPPTEGAAPQAMALDDLSGTRLQALQSAGVTLSEVAHHTLQAWLDAQALDEATTPPTPQHTPVDRAALVSWLRQHPSTPANEGDDWLPRCRKDFWATALCLIELSRANEWPQQRWREALQAWSEDAVALDRSWRCMAPVLHQAPAPALQSLSFAVGQWLRRVASSIDDRPTEFLALLGHVLRAVAEAPSAGVSNLADDPVIQAAYHPAGQLTDVALQWWLNSHPGDAQGLPAPLETLLTQLCDDPAPGWRSARVLLATHVVTLYRAAPSWTRQHLLPWFEWTTHPDEVAGLWRASLRAPRMHLPLLAELREPFLAAADRAEQLGADVPTYAAWLSQALKEEQRVFGIPALRAALNALPSAALPQHLPQPPSTSLSV